MRYQNQPILTFIHSIIRTSIYSSTWDSEPRIRHLGTCATGKTVSEEIEVDLKGLE